MSASTALCCSQSIMPTFTPPKVVSDNPSLDGSRAALPTRIVSLSEGASEAPNPATPSRAIDFMGHGSNLWHSILAAV